MVTFRTPEAAIRAWVERPKQTFTPLPRGWRRQRMGDRALIFDTETTADYAQALLFGFFQVRERGLLCCEGVIIADDLPKKTHDFIQDYARAAGLPIYTRTAFVRDVFYPEVYQLGTLCVGFNLPFDLSRMAIRAGEGRGAHRRSFRLVLDENRYLPDIRIETISSKAAFIAFSPCKRKQQRFFSGRFLDLRALTYAFTGESKSLASACIAFATDERKSDFESFGEVTTEALEYGRQDVRATWSLYERIVQEYSLHPFATFANEYEREPGTIAMTKLYSTASVGKAYLAQFGITPLLEKQPDFPREILGYAMASYFGGRAEVRVRLVEVPVTIVDFTSMYPTVFILQNLQQLLMAKKINIEHCAEDTQRFLDAVTAVDLLQPRVWRKLNRLVKIRPSGEVLPVRCRLTRTGPFQIAVTHYTSQAEAWYTLADCVAAVLLGAVAPQVLDALEFIGEGIEAGLRPVAFRGATVIDPATQIFKDVVEERQKAKRRADDGNIEAARIADALKIFANSAAYGIYAEINVAPPPADGKHLGTVYGTTTLEPCEVHDEEPGRFSNPILATLTTGGARLMLALLEDLVTRAGGVYAFCDTDSLAIVCGNEQRTDVPVILRQSVQEIVKSFDALNPYDPTIVRHLLKIELEDVRCVAISAKRYVIFTRHGQEVQIL